MVNLQGHNADAGLRASCVPSLAQAKACGYMAFDDTPLPKLRENDGQPTPSTPFPTGEGGVRDAPLLTGEGTGVR